MHFALPKRLFPLHLSDIERFLMADDRAAFPMAFVIELTFQGIIDVPLLERALLPALQRHPLLLSKLGPAKNKSLCWLPPDGDLPKIDVAAEGDPIQCPQGEWIDLRKEIGLRIYVRQGSDRSVLTLYFHHACCDGIGAYRFIGDLLAYYACFQAGQDTPEEMPPIDPQRLRGRADRSRLQTPQDEERSAARNAIRHAMGIVGKSCSALRLPKTNKADLPAPFPGICSHNFSRKEADQLRDAAKELGLMLNDLLLLELFYACQAWNKSLGVTPGKQRFRVMMPVDLRGTQDFETPAANILGYTFLTRSDSELQDRAAAARSIREETANIKHHRLGERFVEMVAAGAMVPGLLRTIALVPRTLATVILSNIGDPSRRFLAKLPRRPGGAIVAGNLVLDYISGYPPMRPKSHATFSVVQYKRELTIGLHCNPHKFSLADSQALLDLYIDNLKKHLPVQAATEEPTHQG